VTYSTLDVAAHLDAGPTGPGTWQVPGAQFAAAVCGRNLCQRFLLLKCVLCMGTLVANDFWEFFDCFIGDVFAGI